MSARSTVISLILAQVEANPEAIAVVDGDREIKYQDLAQQAEKIAIELIENGLKPGDLVGVSVQRSIELIVGILGILRAGGAYVPLPPTLPSIRLNQMIQDARLEWVLVKDKPHWDISVCQTVKISLENSHPVSGILLPEIQPEQLAVVLYTSGSTGKPKGVMIEHRNIMAFLNGFEQLIPHKLPMVGSQLASYSFDASVWEIFSNLCYGSTLHIIAHPEDVPALAKAIIRHGFTNMFIPPGILDDLARLLARQPKDVRLNRLLTGVEPIPQQTLQRFRDLAPEIRILNGYGPTETIVCATGYLFKEMDDPTGKTSVGTALPGYTIQLANDQLQTVPTGEMGEVFIGGAAVARGYLNDPELTKSRFITDPFGDHLDLRYYRTGDYARQREDGNLDFIGRMDNQVKIRGFRVETGDVEAALMALPAIKQGVVTIAQDLNGEKQLVAYIVPDPEQSAPSMKEVRRFLAERLPDYMLPALIIPVEKIPRTAHGKTDIQALPKPDWTQRRPGTISVRPRTSLEKFLAEIWSQVLGIKEISVFDNFFELGGDSLQAARLLVRVEQEIGKTLPISILFESRTLSDLAMRLENWRSDSEACDTCNPLIRVPDQKVPLSFSQTRMWFLTHLDPDSSTYHTPFALHLCGDVNIQALQLSINAIVARHAVLRTTFMVENGEPYQLIAQDLAIALASKDLSEIPQISQTYELQSQISHFLSLPFDLKNGPLLRCNLFKLADQDYIFVTVLHHLVFDGWSLPVLLDELQVFYTLAVEIGASNENITPSDLLEAAKSKDKLSDLPIQYKDYAHWQRHGGQEPLFNSQLDFWKNQFRLAQTAHDSNLTLSRMNLPYDYPHQNTRLHSGKGGVGYLRLNKRRIEDLLILGQKSNTTLFMVLLAAFVALLYRYTGQEDIRVGSYVANRNMPDLQRLIGIFINTLVLQVDVAEDLSFSELLNEIRRTALAAYDHQEIPFERLLEFLATEKDGPSHSLFQVAFNFVNKPETTFNLPGLEVQDFNIEADEAINDLHIEDLFIDVLPQNDGLLFKFQYQASLFDADSIERLINHYQVILEAICNDPYRLLVNLPIITRAERQQLLVEWNDTRQSYPDLTFQEIFEAQVEKDPGALAVYFADHPQGLTYQELNVRANQLAHYLSAQGLKSEDLIGVYMERTPDLIVTLLGILKAGAAYLPLDPAYSSEKTAFIIDDAQLSALLCGRENLAQLPNLQNFFSINNQRIFVLEEIQDQLRQFPCTNPPVSVNPTNLAYAIYTFGSTGQPKAVLIEQRSLVNFVRAARHTYDLQPSDRLLQFASISFDTSVDEIFVTLASGACLVLRSSNMLDSLSGFSRLCQLWGVTILDLPTAFWHEWVHALEHGLSDLPVKLRLIILGGDRVRPETLITWQRISDRHIRLINSYRLSETTVAVTMSDDLGEKPQQPGQEVTLGKPIANTQIYLLDSHLNLVPIGVAGEIYIGGVSLGRGYLHDPELDKSRFIQNPFSALDSPRLYKTGDLGRWRKNGEIEFVGRIDEQVKYRGFRIELGEVEAVLFDIPDIVDAAAIVKADPSGIQQLIGYLVPEKPTSFSLVEARSFLKTQLPGYMIPSRFVLLDQLPLTPSNKVDRSALPEPDWNSSSKDQPVIAARTSLEECLVTIWERILKRSPVGVHDNFFELGGHSLLAARLASEIEIEIGLEMPLMTLFERPTIAQLAEALEKQGGLKDDEKVMQMESVPYQPIQSIRSDRSTFPASYGEFRMWLVAQLEPDNPSFNSSFALQIFGKVDFSCLEASLNQIIERHAILRTTFLASEGRPVQVVAPTLKLPLTQIDLSDLSGETQQNALKQKITAIVNKTIDLSTSPLLGFTLFRCAEDQQVLLVTVPHIIFDDWSKAVFLDEMWTCYNALMLGQEPELDELSIQYGDFAVWQQSEEYNRRIEAQLEYWQNQLSGKWPHLQIPPDHPRPATSYQCGSTLSAIIPTEMLQEMRVLANRTNNTIFILLLATLDALLFRYTGQRDILVWSFIANRDRPELQPLIGFLINYVILRTQVIEGMSFIELLEQARATTLGAYSHPDVPIEMLLANFWKELNLLDFRSLFSIVFNFISQAQPADHPRGITVNNYPIETEVAVFDIYLEFVEQQTELLCAVHYNCELYQRETIERLIDDYIMLLREIIKNPEQII